MNNLLLMLLVLIAQQAQAHTYYFASSGNNNTTDNSPSHPYQTLSKIGSLPLHPGDSILLKSGDIFTGTLIIEINGTDRQPVIISTYNGNRPATISGTTVISHWTSIGNGIYSSEPLQPQSAVRSVILDNRLQQQGRYPNDQPGTGGFLIYNSFANFTTTSVIYSDQLAAYGISRQYIGATLKAKSYLSDLESGTITNINGNAITFVNTNMFYQLGYKSAGFYLTNSIYTLDLLGEWYYNHSDKRLYMYFGNSNPNGHHVEVATTDILLQPRCSNYKIANIVLRGANKYAICSQAKGRRNITLSHSTILFTGLTAIALASFSKLTVDSCTIDQSNNNGINVGYECDSITITNTTITNTGMLTANLWCDSTFQKRMGYGIYSGESPHRGLYAKYNKVINSAFNGIFVSGNNNYVGYNYFANNCLYLDDGGAIYIYGNKKDNFKNNFIQHNIILNTPGYWYGFPINHGIPNSIFMDDNASGIDVSYNYINGSGQAAICVHNGHDISIHHNIITNIKQGYLWIQDDGMGGRVRNLSIHHNQLLVTDTTQLMFRLYATNDTSDNKPQQFGATDYNYLIAPNIKTGGIMSLVNVFKLYGYTYSLPQWQTIWHNDLHSVAVNTAKQEVRTYYAVDRDSTIHVQGTWYTPGGSMVKDSIRLPHHSAVILLRYQQPYLITRK